MKRKREKELEKFFDANRKLYFNSLGRTFVELYSSGNFEKERYSGSRFINSLEKKLTDNLLVMKRKEEILNSNKDLSRFVCIMPLIDIYNEDREQITPKEFKSLYREFEISNRGNNNPEKSLLVLPHSYYNFLSSPLSEIEVLEGQRILNNRGYSSKEKKFSLVCHKKDHLKILNQIYKNKSFPFIVSKGSNGDKNKIIPFFENSSFMSPVSKYRRIKVFEPNLRYSKFNITTLNQTIDLKDSLGYGSFLIESYKPQNNYFFCRDKDNELKEEAYKFIKDFGESQQRMLF